MLNELRQGLIYNLEGQSGPVHAPVFTMTVEVIQFNLLSIRAIKIDLLFHFCLIAGSKKRSMVKSTLDKEEVKNWHAFRQPKRH